MVRRSVASVGVVVIVSALLLSGTAWAQQTSSIAGVVKDTSGAVLPGVTVEAASPALIEKVRTVVTDGEGQYKIVDLRTGTYVVTFTLAGFSTFRREGIELTSGFTAAVNADMKVGALEETVTVTGASPLVDTQNVRKQLVVSKELLSALPTGLEGVSNLSNLTPGVVGYGLLTGEYQGNISLGFHGQVAGQTKQQFDGMGIDNIYGAMAYTVNPDAVEEMTLQTSGITAESNAAGMLSNMIPKEGGNIFKGSFGGTYNNDKLQSDNLTDELRARGVKSVNVVQYIYEIGGTFGGPVRKDKLWFFAALRAHGHSNQTADVYWPKFPGAPVYTPDLSRPANRYEYTRNQTGRVTWQASQRNKFAFFADRQVYCICRRSSLSVGPEAGGSWLFNPQGTYQATWSAPVTNKLLLEAGASTTISHWPAFFQPDVTDSTISFVELSANYRYNAAGGYNNPQTADRFAQRGSVSYITGSHAFKTGFNLEEGIYDNGPRVNQNVTYNVLRGVPVSLTQFATPYRVKNIMKADLGIYGQDQWTIKRLTLYMGLRYEYFNAYVPAQVAAATPNGWVPERSFAKVEHVPLWKDLSPRLGAAYDLFGNGRTAVKVSFGKYTAKNSTAIALANNPINTSVNNVSRTWNDTNGNYVPDCDLGNRGENRECGAVSDQNFGGLNVTTRYADDAIHGWGIRGYNWDVSAEVQHQLTPQVSVTGGYYRNWYGSFTTTDNLAVSTADFSHYCITAPKDPRLPGGGGFPVCGLYDVSLAKFGKVDNLVTQVSHYGKQTRASNFFAGSFSTRFGAGINLGGGVDFGRTVTDNCFVVDSPQQLLYCHQLVPFRGTAQLKLNGSYPLPGGFVVSSVLQNVAGPVVLADYVATNAEIEPTLGRNLAACGTRTPCTATTATGAGVATSIVSGTVPLIEPYTQFEDRRTQIDVRLTKFIRLGPKARLQANMDIYNIVNTSPLTQIVTTYGVNWRKPSGANSGSGLQDARLIQFSGQLSF